MKYAQLRIVVVFAAAAAGCASAHVSLYTLSPTPPSAANMPRAALVVQLPSARVPAEVNRREIVVRTSGEQLTLLENAQWASLPGDQISSAVLVEFSAQLDKIEPGIRERITALALSIDVHQFEAVMGRHDVLSATWNAEIRQGAGVVRLSCSFSATHPIAFGISAIVVGYQQEVAELADAIAHGVNNSLSQNEPFCPSIG